MSKHMEISVRLKRPAMWAFRGIALEEQIQTILDFNTMGGRDNRVEYIRETFGVEATTNPELYRGTGYIEELLPQELSRVEKLELTAFHLSEMLKDQIQELEEWEKKNVKASNLSGESG